MVSESVPGWTVAWLALIRTHARLWDLVEAQMLRDSGLTMPRYDLLMHLDAAGGKQRLSELASTIVLSPSGLSKLVDRMEASGLLCREPDPLDGRATFARITPRGRSLVRKARLIHHAWLQRIFGDLLDERDIGDLIRVMGRLAPGQAVSQDPSSPQGSRPHTSS